MQQPHSVLVTNLEDDTVTLVQHDRDRADCENVFDEIKNQWGWGGFTTQDLGSCQRMTRIIALVYNGWSLFLRLAHPDKHTQAITSRPLLLSRIGHLTRTGRQKRMVITRSHAQTARVEATYRRMVAFFNELKRIAPQLSPQMGWARILANAMTAFGIVIQPDPLKLLAAPTGRLIKVNRLTNYAEFNLLAGLTD